MTVQHKTKERKRKKAGRKTRARKRIKNTKGWDATIEKAEQLLSHCPPVPRQED